MERLQKLALRAVCLYYNSIKTYTELTKRPNVPFLYMGKVRNHNYG